MDNVVCTVRIRVRNREHVHNLDSSFAHGCGCEGVEQLNPLWRETLFSVGPSLQLCRVCCV